MQTLMGTLSPWQSRIVRARQLAGAQKWSGEIMSFYAEVAGRQAKIAEMASASPPSVPDLAPWVARHALPLIVEVASQEGPGKLRQEVLARFHEADLEALIRSWLAGSELEPVDTFLGRAATAPILEALPSLASETGSPAGDGRHCPNCGGLPQVSYFGVSGEVLVTAPRYLQCSRCAHSWTFPRLVCAGCGETEAPRLSVLSDPDRLPGVRVDACESCRTYLLTIELPKDAAAVPLVDELAALPLDLHAKECGLTKVTPNLMGF